MSIFDMTYNIVASSNNDDVPNILPNSESTTDYWMPDAADDQNTLNVSMPEVNYEGRVVTPDDYLTIEIRIRSNGNIGNTSVKVYDISGGSLFEGIFSRAPFNLGDFLPGARRVVIQFMEPKEIYELNIIVCMPPPWNTETETTTLSTTPLITASTTSFIFESTTSTISRPPTTAELACRITDAVIENLRNTLPVEAMQPPPLVGWIEKDGKTGLTSPAEEVFKGEKVEAGVVININPCYSCSCGLNFAFNCSAETDSWLEPTDTCLVHYCENGITKTTDRRNGCNCTEDEELVIDNAPSSSCCYCQRSTTGATLINATTPEIRTTPPPPTPCQLKEVSQRLVFNTTDGDFCQSPGELLLPECDGACNGYDRLHVKAWWAAAEPRQECKCCTGVGRYEPRTVNCTVHGETTVDVLIFQQCICTVCADDRN
jgi:hypothetical protein